MYDFLMKIRVIEVGYCTISPAFIFFHMILVRTEISLFIKF